MDSLQERCMSLTPRGVSARGHTVKAPGMRLAGAILPSRPSQTRVGVVLLPQVGGFCGWLAFAKELALRGVVAFPVDLCGYGDSECRGEPSVARQVNVAGDYLRREFGVTRVVLVGASMGGSQTVRAVAGGAKVDAWADISGPSAWEGDRLLALARDVDGSAGRGLVVHARRDGIPSEFGRAQLLAKRTGADFLGPGGGHGWDLIFRRPGTLTAVGARVLEVVCAGDGCPR